MKKLYLHIKKHLIRGLLTIIPIGLTIIVLVLLYNQIDRPVNEIVNKIIGYRIPGLGILFLVIILYCFGLIVSNYFGRRLLTLIEEITVHIPFVKTFYLAGKQIAGAFTMHDCSAFKRTVLVQYLSPGQWTLGFITGVMHSEQNGEMFYRIYVPTPPLPTSGVIIIVRESLTLDPGISVEDAIKIIVSCGIIGPETLKAHIPKLPEHPAEHPARE